jgi:tetratricopeptide (TPR) repeat protein
VSDLPPQLEVQYWLQAGIGYESFGDHDEARAFLERALQISEENELYQFVIESDQALAALGKSARRPEKATVTVSDEHVERVVDRLRAERESIEA